MIWDLCGMLLQLFICRTLGTDMDVVYVDEITGTNNPWCGFTQKTPCKDLKKGVKITKESGIVHVIGNHHLQQSVVLSKSISIIADSTQQGRITANGSVDFAFIPECGESLKVKLIGIHFDNISVFNVHCMNEKYPIIEIERMTVSNISGDEPAIQFDTVYSDSSGSLNIHNSLFIDTTGLSLTQMEKVRLNNCTFRNPSKWNYRSLIGIYECTRVIINKCNFNDFNSPHEWMSSFIDMRSGSVEITGSSFYNGTSGGGCTNFLEAITLLIEESKFEKCRSLSKSSESGGGAIQIDPGDFGKVQKIRKCLFLSNSAPKFGGGLLVIESQNKWSYAEIHIKDSLFIINEATKSGQAILIRGHTRQIRNLVIISNVKNDADHLYAVGKEDMSLSNVSIRLEVFGVITNSMTKNVMILKNSMGIDYFDEVRLVCPKQFNAIHDYEVFSGGYGKRASSINVICRTCRSNHYTLAHGEVNFHQANKYEDQYVNATNNQPCIPCPMGAICDGNVIPVDGHWGSSTGDQLEFIQCPNAFCCSRQTVLCTSYNTCATGRSGTLCGSCSKGFSQSFVSKGCVLKADVTCNTGIFVAYFIIFSLLYTIIFTFLPHIIEVVKDKIEGGKQYTENDRLEMEECDSITINVRTSSDNKAEHSIDKEPLPITAFITLVCFYLQVASLVHVNVQTQNIQKAEITTGHESSENAFLKSLFDFCNFRVAMYQRVCPMDDLTLPMKEFINVALKMCSIFNLFIFYLIWKFFVLFKSYFSKSQDQKTCSSEHHRNVEGDVEGTFLHKDEHVDRTKLSFASITKIGFVKLVKLNFTSLSTFTLQMINCVSVGGQLHLYLYGDLLCYHWWQQIILFAVLPVVILFPLSFGISLNMLKERSISPAAFLFLSMMPFCTLIFWVKKKAVGLSKCNLSDEDKRCIKEILLLEEQLYWEDDHAFRWPVIQLYRNLLVAVLNTFILNTVYRSVVLLPVFMLFGLHDARRLPFKHIYLNNLQMLTSACLLIINTCNVLPSFSIAFDLMVMSAMGDILRALKYLELALLAIVPMSLPAWKLWEKIKEK